MKPLNALVLDDDPNFNQLIKAKLKPVNICVKATSTAKEFFAEFVSRKWDLCIIDLNLKEGPDTGFQVIEIIRQKVKSSTPLLLISRSDEPEKIAHGIERGADDYLTKPLDVDMITSKIHFLLNLEKEWEGQNLLGVSPVPSPARNAKLTLNLATEFVSEDGVGLVANFFVGKGTILSLSGPTIEEVFARESVKLMVSKNSKLTGDRYSVFCEFGDQEELTLLAKNWITRKRAA